MRRSRLTTFLGAVAAVLGLAWGAPRAFAEVRMPEPQAKIGTEAQVTFAPEAGTYFPRVIALVLGLTACETPLAHTWSYQLMDPRVRNEFALLFSTMPCVASVDPAPQAVSSPKPYVEGEILVKFKRGVTAAQIAALNAQESVTVLDQIPGIEVWRLKLPAGTTVEAMIQVYEGSGLVEYAEPNHRISVPTMPGLPGSRSERRVTRVRVTYAPGTSPDLMNLVFGTHTLGSAPEGGWFLSPSPKTTAAVQARILRLCPSVLHSEAVS